MKLRNYFTATLFLLGVILGFGQTDKKLDKIIKKDSQIIACTISEISDKIVIYSLPGESLKIDLEISKVARIDFASGRTQTFDDTTTENATAEKTSTSIVANAQIKTNIIAVLPVPFMNTESLQASAEMAKFAQNDLYNKLVAESANIAPLTVQDLRTTNSLLHKAGIDYTNIDETPIEDLEKILGVDNIVATKVSYTTTTSTTSTSYNSENVKVSDNNKKAKVDDFGVTNSNTDLSYNFVVYFDMYKNTTKIYSKTRTPFLYFKDSWIDSISYLLKRSPIYVKK